MSFNPEFNQNTFSEKDVLSAFRQESKKHTEIRQGMSPREISDVVSEHLMSVVKQQFETAKKEYQAKKNK